MAGTGTGAYHKRNLVFPLQRSGRGFRQAVLIERFEAALLHLAATKKGAYYGDPNYGTIVYRLRTQDMTEALRQAALESLRYGAGVYIPDIQVHDLKSEIDDDLHKNTLSIFWTIRGATNQMHGELADVQVSRLSL